MILTGCKKQVQTDEPYINEYRAPTCEENPLFCEDFEDDDLPESGDDTDTGE
tara:strand:+ start:321 stop:476 length:156 start_codon:yes stop_codon:yes gene_type:complete